MTAPHPPEPYPTVAEVESIVTVDDACVRNLRITDCYARLSSAVRARIGEGANWCSFATWASRQAGCTVRGEDFGDRLADLLKGEWQVRRPLLGVWRFLLRRGLFNQKSWLGRIVHAIHSPFDAFERASEAVAIGNRKVFEEIGREFARYLADPDFDGFCNALAPGPPTDGQDWLRRAFMHYHEAGLASDPRRRAQLMLLANLEIGFHEQTRLQPEIQRAMEAGVDTAVDLKARLPGGKLLLIVFAPFVRRYRRFAGDLTRRAISETLMVLRMPDATLQLGSNLAATVPSVFFRCDEPALSEFLTALEPVDCKDCGARDWADLRERMHYIFHLFRAYHGNSLLFDAPFSAVQTEAIRARPPSIRSAVTSWAAAIPNRATERRHDHSRSIWRVRTEGR